MQSPSRLWKAFIAGSILFLASIGLSVWAGVVKASVPTSAVMSSSFANPLKVAVKAGLVCP